MSKYKDIILEAANLIGNKTIREYALTKLNTAPTYFYTTSASGTGRYHPKIARGPSGLIKHTILVTLITYEILDMPMYRMTNTRKDLTVAAALLHDLYKQGKEDEGGPTKDDHAKIAYEEFKKDGFEGLGILVLTHLGEHGKNQPYSDEQKVLAIADRLASRKWLDCFTDDESFVKNISEVFKRRR